MRTLIQSAIVASCISIPAISSAQPVSGTYNSSHAFAATIGKTSKTIKIEYRSFNNSVAITACPYHCRTEYLGFDKTNSKKGIDLYKSLTGNYLVQLNQAQWLYMPQNKDSRLLTMKETEISKKYSLKAARNKVARNYSELLAAE